MANSDKSEDGEDKKIPARETKKAASPPVKRVGQASTTESSTQDRAVHAASAAQRNSVAPTSEAPEGIRKRNRRRITKAAELASHNPSQHPADCHKDNESPENETPEERRLRKNRINERRKRAKRKMKIDYLADLKKQFTDENEQLRSQNQQIREHVAAIRAGRIPPSTLPGVGISEAGQQQESVQLDISTAAPAPAPSQSSLNVPQVLSDSLQHGHLQHRETLQGAAERQGESPESKEDIATAGLSRGELSLGGLLQQSAPLELAPRRGRFISSAVTSSSSSNRQHPIGRDFFSNLHATLPRQSVPQPHGSRFPNHQQPQQSQTAPTLLSSQTLTTQRQPSGPPQSPMRQVDHQQMLHLIEMNQLLASARNRPELYQIPSNTNMNNIMRQSVLNNASTWNQQFSGVALPASRGADTGLANLQSLLSGSDNLNADQQNDPISADSAGAALRLADIQALLAGPAGSGASHRITAASGGLANIQNQFSSARNFRGSGSTDVHRDQPHWSSQQGVQRPVGQEFGQSNLGIDYAQLQQQLRQSLAQAPSGPLNATQHHQSFAQAPVGLQQPSSRLNQILQLQQQQQELWLRQQHQERTGSVPGFVANQRDVEGHLRQSFSALPGQHIAAAATNEEKQQDTITDRLLQLLATGNAGDPALAEMLNRNKRQREE